MISPSPQNPGTPTRRDKLLRIEVDACEDPICCCEAEPRWLRFQPEGDEPTEWECIDRAPCDEL